jgi:hypothetical protein
MAMPADTDDNTPMAMISFPDAEGGGCAVERMHARSLGGGRYVLDNSPFYAFGISFDDVFLAEQKDGELIFSQVIRRGGHSTYRIKLPVGCDHEYFLKHWTELDALGCTFEGSSATPQRLYSIDVPPTSDVFEVYRVLEEKEQQKFWSFEEAHYWRSRLEKPGPGLET